MRRLLLLTTTSLALGTACEVENSCDEYVAYICDCHDASEGADYDCATQSNIYAEADAEQQEFCATALAEIQAEDAAAGYVCGDGDTGDSGIASAP